MKWETLKRRVADCVAARVERGIHDPSIMLDLVLSDFHVLRNMPHEWKHHAELLRVYADQVRCVVNNWDIRCVGGLRDRFPDYFPRKLRRGILNTSIDAKGVWVVLPT